MTRYGVAALFRQLANDIDAEPRECICVGQRMLAFAFCSTLGQMTPGLERELRDYHWGSCELAKRR